MRTGGWQIENADMGTRRKVKAFAAANGLTIAEALTQLVNQALQAATPANETGNHTQSGTKDRRVYIENLPYMPPTVPEK